MDFSPYSYHPPPTPPNKRKKKEVFDLPVTKLNPEWLCNETLGEILEDI